MSQMTDATHPTVDFWRGAVVRLRAIETTDVANFLRWNEDSERGRLLDFLWPPQSEAAVRAWVEEQARRKLEGDAYHWVIENAQGDAVGSIATHHCNQRDGVFSYGLDIDCRHRRRGYARAAIGLVLRYYFDHLRYHKASVMVHGDNEASLRLHDRLGFVREGILREQVFTNGVYVDLILFGLTADEFRRRPW